MWGNKVQLSSESFLHLEDLTNSMLLRSILGIVLIVSNAGYGIQIETEKSICSSAFNIGFLMN